MTKDEKYINLLVNLAAGAEPVAGARIAAGLVYKGDMISFGVNSRKTHPFQVKFQRNAESIFLHAETSAIKNALYLHSLEEIAKSTLYVVRVKYPSPTDKTLIFGLAKPCEGCERAIAEFGIKRVVYTLDGSGYGIL